ncbi:MAG: hypothetical protein JO264_21965 [Acidisphaera sp.]|nr:hypothetical protein [Acidisphaera sp.]
MRVFLLLPALALALGAPAPQARAAAPGIVLVDANYGSAGDDTDFLFRLGMLEGHLIVGHDLLQAGRPQLALPHFGHPVRELYDDIADYVQTHHIAPFDTQLIRLEAAVARAPTSPDTEKQYQAIIATVHAARQVAPQALRDSIPEMIKICSETIDAASGEYGSSLDHGRVEVIVEYHDSRGYISYVQQEVDRLAQSYPDAADQGILARFKAVLAKAQWIVQPLLPDPQPRASVGQYRAVAAEAAAIARE